MQLLLLLRTDENCYCFLHLRAFQQAGMLTRVLMQDPQRWEPVTVAVLVEQWHFIDEGHLQV